MAESPGPEQKPPTSWRDLHLWQIQPIRDVLVVLAIVLLLRLGYMLSLVTVPILLAILFAYLFEPIILRLTRIRRINRSIAAGGIIVAAAALIVVPVAIGIGFAVVQGVSYAQSLAKNVDLVIKSSEEPENEELRQRLPNDSWIWVRDQVAEWRLREQEAERQREEELKRRASRRAEEERREPAPSDDSPSPPPTTDDEPADPTARADQLSPLAIFRSDSTLAGFSDMVLRWLRDNAEAISADAAKTGATAFSAALNGVISIGKLLFMGFLTAFFFFFFSTGWGSVRQFWRNLIPEKRRERTLVLIGMMDRVVSGFVRGRLTIAAIQTVFFIVGYWLVGVPVPLILGPVVGLLSIVPYVGLLGIPITVIAMFLDPQPLFLWQEAWWWAVVGPIVVYQLGQFMDDYVLTPLIQGKSTDMDAPAILFASISGGILAGVYGLLLAIPVAACVKILLREVVWPRFHEWTQGRTSDPLPLGRIPKADPPPPHNPDI
ncbi:MAG: AI-2E family transporter [Phycisphaeraceae bacterium]|nr:AI-2E family transporter [Phycisphaeraceae bacterium]MCW5753230.1 AI-2E family transporter [Phycisphaeraceae bacterium]